MPIFESLLLLGGPTKLVVAAVEDDESSLESNVTENVQSNAAGALQTTEGGSGVDVGVVENLAGDGDVALANTESQVMQDSDLGEDETALVLVIAGTANTTVVGVDNAVREEGKSGAGVSNTVNGAGGDGGAVGGEAVGVELPEALAVVDGDVVDVAGVGLGVKTGACEANQQQHARFIYKSFLH